MRDVFFMRRKILSFMCLGFQYRLQHEISAEQYATEYQVAYKAVNEQLCTESGIKWQCHNEGCF